MDKILLKVDRVATVEEALELERLGVDILSVDIVDREIFDDDRTIEVEQAQLIKNSLTKAKLSGNFHDDSWGDIEDIDKIKLDYVEYSGRCSLDLDIKDELDKRNIKIIYSSLITDIEEDPNRILASLDPRKLLDGMYYQINLMGGMKDAWKTLKEICPKEPEYLLQIADIDKLSREYPLSIALNYSAENFQEILSFLPNIKVAAFVLGEKCKRIDYHYFQYSQVVDIISKINAIL